MLRKSNISLSNRVLFYITKKETLQQHEKLQSSNRVQTNLSKQEISNSIFLKLRYTRVRVHSQPFQDANRDSGQQPNKYNVTTVTPSLGTERVLTTQTKSNQHNFSYLRRVFSRDVSVQWLQRIGFSFSPFAFIFGTTFLFAAFTSSLQKQDGKKWPGTLSQTKLPGLTENKITQTSSWVFLESVLLQYINRDNSFKSLPSKSEPAAVAVRSGLVNTTSLAKDILGPYSLALRAQWPVGPVRADHQNRPPARYVAADSSQSRQGVTPAFTLASAEPSIGTVE